MRAKALDILHVLPSLNPGGAERLVVELTTAARKRGIDARIAVLAPASPSSPLQDDVSRRGLPVTVLGRHRFDPTGYFRLWRLSHHATIVHAHLFPAFYAASLSRRGGLVLTEHSPTNTRRYRRWLAPFERFVYGRYDVKVAVSESVGDALRQYLRKLNVGAALIVIPNGIDLNRFSDFDRQVGPDPRLRGTTDLRLVAVGTLDARKNMRAAIEAVAGLERVCLTVVGDGPERLELSSLVEKCGARAAVTFLGLRNDIPSILRAHDALLMTSRYEGFGLVAVEAMAAGLPVIAPRIPGLIEVLGDAGITYASNDPESLTRAILNVRDNESMRLEFANRALHRAQQFDIAHVLDAYLKVYDEMKGTR